MGNLHNAVAVRPMLSHAAITTSSLAMLAVMPLLVMGMLLGSAGDSCFDTCSILSSVLRVCLISSLASKRPES